MILFLLSPLNQNRNYPNAPTGIRRWGGKQDEQYEGHDGCNKNNSLGSDILEHLNERFTYCTSFGRTGSRFDKL